MSTDSSSSSSSSSDDSLLIRWVAVKNRTIFLLDKDTRWRKCGDDTEMGTTLRRMLHPLPVTDMMFAIVPDRVFTIAHEVPGWPSDD